jgi:hypothetical protein
LPAPHGVGQIDAAHECGLVHRDMEGAQRLGFRLEAGQQGIVVEIGARLRPFDGPVLLQTQVESEIDHPQPAASDEAVPIAIVSLLGDTSM